MKKNITKIAVALAVTSLATSCYEDKGNYSYRELDKVVISTDGLVEDEYTIDRGDKLTLAPDVYFNGEKNKEDAPLDYMWTLYSTMSGAGADANIDTLSTERVLNAPINRATGTYRVQLAVTNRNTKTKDYFFTSCTVVDDDVAGMVVLYEPSDMPGYSDFGLVANSFNTKRYEKNKALWGLYSAANGGALEGSPLYVMHCGIPVGVEYIATTKNVRWVNPSNYLAYPVENLFLFGAPDNLNIDFYRTVGLMSFNGILCANGDVYQSTAATGAAGISGFGIKKKGDHGKLAPWTSSMASMLEAVVYDQDNSCFLCIPRGNGNFYTFAAQDMSQCAFDVNNCDGMKLEFGDWGSNFTDYMLFSKGNERYLGWVRFQQAAAGTTNLGAGLKDVTSSPDIQNATAFAVNFLGEYAFYGAGNKVYNLAYNSGNPATVAWEAPSADEVVTCIKTHKVQFSSIQSSPVFMPNKDAVLHIATWNENTKEGKLYEVQIVPTSGAIVPGMDFEYTVPGKVKDMTWKLQMIPG